MASSASARSTRAALAACVAGGLLALSACGPTGGGSSGAKQANPAPAATKGAGAGTGTGPSWVLTTPATAAGYQQGQPAADLIQQYDTDMQQSTRKLGISGTPVHAYYDDQADGAWIFYSGLNGTGFDPDKLHDALDQLPATRDDGAGDRMTTSALDTDPGPHGGRAICDTTLVQAGLLTTAATTCSWFTTTTAAGVTLLLKGDGTNTKLGFTATDVAPIMRAVRADVEQRH
ncbi:hypothetical protein ACIGXM_21560 [Kitasatospora sp. NPDC052896]|uniref:hypothetical protein n=1 Tax=Kitasatospora sp. NPDC052896 TaxID=3364061 RepID=UPI0037C9ED8F